MSTQAREGEGGGGTDVLIPWRSCGHQGRAKPPIVLPRDLRMAGEPEAGSGHVGALAGRDPAPPGNRSATGLTVATCPHSEPATRQRHFCFQLSWPREGPKALRTHGARGAAGEPGRVARERGGGRAAGGALSRCAPLARSSGALTCSGLGWLGGKRSGAAARCARARARFVALGLGVSRPRPPVGSAHCTTAG